FQAPASILSTIIKNKGVILKIYNLNPATWKKIKLGEYSGTEFCLLK
ncbi:tigger transposable element-derived protein 4-like, partial [Aphis craccivora]